MRRIDKIPLEEIWSIVVDTSIEKLHIRMCLVTSNVIVVTNVGGKFWWLRRLSFKIVLAALVCNRSKALYLQFKVLSCSKQNHNNPT